MLRVSIRISSIFLVLASAAVFSLFAYANAQVATTVDGQPITELDIQQRTRFHEMATHKAPSRQDIIDELSREIQEISQAQRHAIAPSDDDVSEAFENVASNMNIDSEKLSEILVKDGASTATLKQRLRADIAESRLKRGGYGPRGAGD